MEKIEVKSELRNIRLVTRKARLVIDLIRGKKAEDALNVLKMVGKTKSPVYIQNVLKSAMANAVNNFGLNRDKLYVSQAYINAGPMFKRYNFRAKGRMNFVTKQTSHVTVFVEEREQIEPIAKQNNKMSIEKKEGEL